MAILSKMIAWLIALFALAAETSCSDIHRMYRCQSFGSDNPFVSLCFIHFSFLFCLHNCNFATGSALRHRQTRSGFSFHRRVGGIAVLIHLNFHHRSFVARPDNAISESINSVMGNDEIAVTSKWKVITHHRWYMDTSSRINRGK